VEVYATITYYHQNRAEVDAYLARVRAWRDQHWQELAEREPPEVVTRLRTCYYQISSHPHPYHLHLHSSNAGKTASKVVWGRGHLYGGEAIPLTIHR
jgi:hypothetical protein